MTKCFESILGGWRLRPFKYQSRKMKVFSRVELVHESRSIMQHNLDQTISLLGRTPAALDAYLRDLPEAWTLRNEGENTWSAFDIVGHLIHGERTDWMPRAKMILQSGESRAFEPFDRR